MGELDVLQQRRELRVVEDGQMNGTRHDASSAIVTGSVSSELENFRGEILLDDE